MIKRQSCLLGLILVLISASANANLAKYVHVRETLFWKELYNEKYHTLFCAIHQEAGNETEITHAYPIAWMANAMRCPIEEQCDFARYKDATSDLHNMWPMMPHVSDIRKHYPYMELEDTEGEVKDCNFRISKDGLEPREWAKGEIARSFLYTIWKYRFPDYDMLPTMIKWAKKYPPNAEEKWRNERIKALQRNDNPFISQPNAIAEAFPEF